MHKDYSIIYVCVCESEVAQCVRLFATLWTVAHQAPPSMGFSGQEYWSRLPLPSPGYLADPGIEPRSPALQADTLTSEPPGKVFVSVCVSVCVCVDTLTSEPPGKGCVCVSRHFNL